MTLICIKLQQRTKQNKEIIPHSRSAGCWFGKSIFFESGPREFWEEPTIDTLLSRSAVRTTTRSQRERALYDSWMPSNLVRGNLEVTLRKTKHDINELKKIISLRC